MTSLLDLFVYALRKHSTNHILDKLTLYTFENGLLTWYFAVDLAPNKREVFIVSHWLSEHPFLFPFLLGFRLGFDWLCAHSPWRRRWSYVHGWPGLILW